MPKSLPKTSENDDDAVLTETDFEEDEDLVTIDDVFTVFVVICLTVLVVVDDTVFDDIDDDDDENDDDDSIVMELLAVVEMALELLVLPPDGLITKVLTHFWPSWDILRAAT